MMKRRAFFCVVSAVVLGVGSVATAEDPAKTNRDAIAKKSLIEPGCPGSPVVRENPAYSAENRSASTDEVFEMPAHAERSLSVAISGTEVCSELAKHKAGGPRMHRGPFAPSGSRRSGEMDRGFCFRPRVDGRAARRQARVGRSVCRRPAACRSVRGRGRVWHGSPARGVPVVVFDELPGHTPNVCGVEEDEVVERIFTQRTMKSLDVRIRIRGVVGRGKSLNGHRRR